MTLDELKALEAAASPGPWRWLGHYIRDDENGGRLWRYTDDRAALDDEMQLTNAAPGDLHYLSAGASPILTSCSTGYGGETNIAVGDADAAFIAVSRTMLPRLIAVAEAAGRLVAATNPLIDSDPHRERQAVSQALAALEAP